MAIPVERLQDLARARLKDAEVLLNAGRCDGGFYLCGYAVELALKARICRTLEWAGYPESTKELPIFRQLHSHDLDMLLKLTGQERRIRSHLTAEWSVIRDGWSPGIRYNAPGVQPEDLEDAIAAATALVDGLLP